MLRRLASSATTIRWRSTTTARTTCLASVSPYTATIISPYAPYAAYASPLVTTTISNHITIRSFGSKKKKKKQQQGHSNKRQPPSFIQARRPTDKNYKSKYSLPDEKGEKYLAQLQNQLHENYRSGQYRQGLTQAKKLLDECVSKLGKHHPATASAHSDVGLLSKLVGDFDEARSHFTQALQIYQPQVGADHASVASTYHNLGQLNRQQIHLDTTLKATDRLTLLEQAVDSLRRAYHIRLDERGPHHPHTVASKSGLGACLAMQVLQHYKKTHATGPWRSTATVTDTEWDAADEHLRQALETAVEHVRGPGLDEKQTKELELKSRIVTLSAASAAQNLAVFLKARATTASTTGSDDNETSANEKEEEGGNGNGEISAGIPSEDQKGEGEATIEADETSYSHSESIESASSDMTNEERNESGSDTLAMIEATEEADTNNNIDSNEPMKDSDSSTTKQETLQQAKARQDQVVAQGQARQEERATKWFQEAHDLYQDVWALRKELLPKGHPDLYATQHSLAELLAARGDTEAANAMRQDIVDIYDPPSVAKQGEEVVVTTHNKTNDDPNQEPPALSPPSPQLADKYDTEQPPPRLFDAPPKRKSKSKNST